WWFYGTKVGDLSAFQISLWGDVPGYTVYLFYNMSGEDLSYYNGYWHKICDLTNAEWHHFRLVFNCATDTFDIWVDGIKELTGGSFPIPQTSLNMIELYTGTASTGGFYVYFDAFDYSWAPGYITNRNLGFTYAEDIPTHEFPIFIIILVVIALAVIFAGIVIYYKTRRPPTPTRNVSPQVPTRPRNFARTPVQREDLISAPVQYDYRIPLSTEIADLSYSPISQPPPLPIQSELDFAFCPNCGFKHKKADLFCTECGTEL
ncbi:MAG TPA: zinc ribbon domain-containing protein, partial [Candidatus Deferrimicrobium sp.]|nr:zinc ribbon domain-containing protein [Candidatus Deferrimicrobium sp.]